MFLDLLNLLQFPIVPALPDAVDRVRDDFAAGVAFARAAAAALWGR